jgi:hypothetical protein
MHWLRKRQQYGVPAICLAIFSLFIIVSCNKPLPAPIQAVLTPIKATGCAVQQAITGAFGAEVVTECAGTDPAGCGEAFQEALGNVNLCTAPLPQAAPAPGLAPQSVVAVVWKTVGDVPADALKAKPPSGGLKAQALKPQGIVGAIACPIAINAGLGLLTAKVPAACGCKQNLSAGQLGAALSAICVSAVPL